MWSLADLDFYSLQCASHNRFSYNIIVVSCTKLCRPGIPPLELNLMLYDN